MGDRARTKTVTYLFETWIPNNPVRLEELKRASFERLEPMTIHVPFQEESIANYLRYANARPGIYIIINTDCAFASLDWVENFDFDHYVAIITRHNSDGTLGHPTSYDAWAFTTPITVDYSALETLKPSEIARFAEFGIDNRIAYELTANSKRLAVNPCLDVRLNHYHDSNVRTYAHGRRLKGMYTVAEPCKLAALEIGLSYYNTRTS